LDVTTPFSPRRVLWDATGLGGVSHFTFKSHIKIKPLADVWFRAKGGQTNTFVEVFLEYYLLTENAAGA
jgi:hypothetical protein